ALSNAIRPGLIGWMKTLSREVGPKKITVNSLAPGSIETERLTQLYANRSRSDAIEAIPLRRFGSPQEIADVVCFLASDRASYFVDVLVRKASLFEDWFPGIRSGATIVPAEAIVPPGVNETAREEEALRQMSMSQQAASAVALRSLGYRVVARPIGALVSEIV